MSENGNSSENKKKVSQIQKLKNYKEDISNRYEMQKQRYSSDEDFSENEEFKKLKEEQEETQQNFIYIVCGVIAIISLIIFLTQ